MKLSLLQENLKKALSVVSRAVPGKPTYPILNNVLLRVDENGLRLSATNLEIGISTLVQARVEQHGTITLPAKLLQEVVNGLPNATIDMTLSEKQNSVRIVCGRFDTIVDGISADEFPAVATAGGDPIITLEPAALREALDQVVVAAADNNNRPVLAGVLFRFGEQLTLAGCDGHRVAVKQLDAPQTENTADLIIPAASLAEIARIIEDEPVSISLAPNTAQIVFSCGKLTAITRLIDGMFPDYTRIIPENHNTRIIVDRDQLIRVIKLASVFGKQTANIIRLQIQPSEAKGFLGGIILSSNAGGYGAHKGEIDGQVTGEAIETASNCEYLLDALRVMTVSQVAIELNSHTAPIVIKPVDDASYIHVIMPMTLGKQE